MQSSQPIYQLEDVQLLQIIVDNETDGREFEFATDFLAKEIVLKGYSIYCDIDQKVPYTLAKGHFMLDIQWLKLAGTALNANYLPVQVEKVMLPFAFDGIESNMAMNHVVSLPSQTTMRKRFKVTLKALTPAGEVLFSSIHPMNYRVVLHLEVKHNHIFK